MEPQNPPVNYFSHDMETKKTPAKQRGARGGTRRPQVSTRIRKPLLAISDNFTIDVYRAEFDANGPLMGIIIEYLVAPDAAFAYAVACPGVDALEKVARMSTPTEGVMFAVSTKQRKLVDGIVNKHPGKINWGQVALSAAGLGNLVIIKQLRPLIPRENLGMIMRVAARDGFTVLMDQLAEWKVPADSGLIAAAESGCMRGFRRALKLKVGSHVDAFVAAARRGRIEMLKILWKIRLAFYWSGFSGANISSVIHRARLAACRRGMIRTLRYLDTIHPEKWSGAEITEAALRGHVPLCHFLLKSTQGMPAPVLNTVLENPIVQAAQAGHLPVLRILIERVSKEGKRRCLNLALNAAGSRGHTTIAKAARSWGADAFHVMLVMAAAESQLACMRLAKDWGATNFEEALAAQPRGPAGDLLRSWLAAAQLPELTAAQLPGWLAAARILSDLDTE